MATRSRIAVELPDGKVKSVYCHNNGYLEGVGKDLLSLNFLDSYEVEEFIEEGDRTTVELSYREWRGEICPPDIHESVSDFFKGDIEEYGYLFTQEGEWLVKSAYRFPQSPITLVDALNREDLAEDLLYIPY